MSKKFRLVIPQGLKSDVRKTRYGIRKLNWEWCPRGRGCEVLCAQIRCHEAEWEHKLNLDEHDTKINEGLGRGSIAKKKMPKKWSRMDSGDRVARPRVICFGDNQGNRNGRGDTEKSPKGTKAE
ncbi:hypothetical protein C8R44DRAFT_741866 [Mycena epipterygia]|nr:hypothetical protein C8R44DRAFT_741866 [Mycena epipterygia]